MKTKQIIFIAIGLLALGGGLMRVGGGWSDGLQASVSAGGGSLAAERIFHDFGRISMAAGAVKTTFTLRNGGTEPATVRKLYTSCMCTTAKIKTADGTLGPFGMPGHGFLPTISSAVAAGGEAEVEVAFDPAAHGPAGLGKMDRSVFVETASGERLELRISSFVTP